MHFGVGLLFVVACQEQEKADTANSFDTALKEQIDTAEE